MGKLHLNIFSFDSRIDFQNGYVRQDIYYKSNDTLKDVFNYIDSKLFGYQEFGVNMNFIYCRINGYAIFGNMPVNEIVNKLGNVWEIEPISKKYATKDLLLNFDIALNKYEDFFYQMDFITPSQINELKKYILINFIATSYDDSYLGDGFFLYIKWLITHYPLHTNKLLKFIATNDGNIFEHISISGFIFPCNKIIDMQIESLQAMILSNESLQKECRYLKSQISKQYDFSCKNKIVGYNQELNFASIQDILCCKDKEYNYILNK